MKHWLAVAFGLASGCAGATAHSSSSVPPPSHASAMPPPSVDGLESLRARAGSGDASALASFGVRLAAAGSAHDLTGERATDDRVERAALVTRDGATAAILIVTTCGNATLASVHWDGTQWTTVEHLALIEGVLPGQCAQSSVRAEGVALSSDARREIAVVVASQDATGDEIRGPFLSVYRLEPEGALHPLLHNAAFGGMDDTTGATTQGSFLVVEDIPAPRPLHVTIRPGRAGPGGAPAAEVVHRAYAIHGNRMDVVEEHTDAAE